MSLEIWNIFFDEVSRELGIDPALFREKLDRALCRFVEQQVVQSMGILSIEEGWLLSETDLDEEPLVSIPGVEANASTLRYLQSRVSPVDLLDVIERLQSTYPEEFITPTHVDKLLL